jgi:hypothetical protein
MSLKFKKTIIVTLITLSSISTSHAHWVVPQEKRLNWVSDPNSADESGFDTAEPCLIFMEKQYNLFSYFGDRYKIVQDLYLDSFSRCIRLRWRSETAYERLFPQETSINH